MTWQCIDITVNAEEQDIISDLLFDMGAISVTSSAGDSSEIFEINGQTQDHWQFVKLTAMFEQSVNIDSIVQQLSQCTSASINTSKLKDENWEVAWHKHFTQLKINEKLWICPSWLEPVDDKAINIRIDPGMSFGTGTHQSTRLCLDWISEIQLEGKSMIDYGCGSGILAIAAIEFGAKSALATDIEPRSLTATMENARQNNVEKALQVYLPERLPKTSCDLVVANILSGTIISLSSILAGLTKPDGYLLLAGILKDQEQTIRDTFVEFQWQSRYLDNWVALLGKR